MNMGQVCPGTQYWVLYLAALPTPICFTSVGFRGSGGSYLAFLGIPLFSFPLLSTSFPSEYPGSSEKAK